jgi:hypothetical protein
MKNSATFILVCATILTIAACGGSGGGNAGDDTHTTTRNLKGSLVTPNSNISAPASPSLNSNSDVEGSCSIGNVTICKVIATASDATTIITDTRLTECTFSLNLIVGKDYVISLVGPNPETGACDTFVATMLASSGSIFHIGSGDAIDLGNVTISDGIATFTGRFSDFLSCAILGFDDSDFDGLCDGWDGELPDSESSFDSTECESSSDCGDGEFCTACGDESGYCLSTDYVCTEGNSCGTGNKCVADLCDDPVIGYCEEVEEGEEECDADADCSWLGDGATCSDGFCSEPDDGDDNQESCTTDDDCSGDDVCDDGTCVAGCSDNSDCADLYDGENKMVCDTDTHLCGEASLADLVGDYVAVEGIGDGCVAYTYFPESETVTSPGADSLELAGTAGEGGEALCSHTQTDALADFTSDGLSFEKTGVTLDCPENEPPEDGVTTNTITFDVSTWPFELSRVVSNGLSSPFANGCGVLYEMQE